MNNIRIAAVIPARMNSSRFQGKPLLEIHDLPMVEHVRRRSLSCDGFSRVVVATCDKEIRETVESFGGEVIMTSAEHVSASDRVSEAMESIDCTHVVNVQGDEVLILPEDLRLMIKAIKKEPEGNAWNAVGEVKSVSDLKDSSIVNCVVSKSNSIIFFSRNLSRFGYRSGGRFDPFYINLGVLGYSRRFLEDFLQMGVTPLEEIESVEQFRTLENDIPIRAVFFKSSYPGINEPKDVKTVQAILTTDDRQKQILDHILNFYIE